MMDDSRFGDVSPAPGGTPRLGSGLRARLFALIPILLLLAVIAAVAYKQQVFEAQDQLFTYSDSAAGITVGMQVKIQGFTVGTVKALALTPSPAAGANANESANADFSNTQVRIELAVGRAYIGLIGKDAVASVVREGLIGQPILEIRPGSGAARSAANGDVLPFEKSRGIADIAQDLSRKMGPLIDDTRAAVGQLKDPNSDVAAVIHETRRAVAEAAEAARAARVLLVNVDRLADQTARQASDVLSTTNRLVTQIETVVPKVERIVDNAGAITSDVRHTVQQAQGKVIGLADDAQRLSNEAGQIVDGVRSAWPVRLWLPSPPAKALTVDSQGGEHSYIEPPAAKDGP